MKRERNESVSSPTWFARTCTRCPRYVSCPNSLSLSLSLRACVFVCRGVCLP